MISEETIERMARAMWDADVEAQGPWPFLPSTAWVRARPMYLRRARTAVAVLDEARS